MKITPKSRSRGFTLLETVIAIGVLSVLLTGFIVVFTPAADGIRKSINIQQADRLASTVEQELVTLRGDGETRALKTGFDKAFERIKNSNTAATALVVYQYRAQKNSLRNDGTPTPITGADDKVKIPGENYTVVSVMRTLSDRALFQADLPAIEGSIYLVKCKQLVFASGKLEPSTNQDAILDPTGATTTLFASAATYPEAVIAFTADFYMLPAKTAGYFTNTLPGKFANLTKPVFSRNLAVRR